MKMYKRLLALGLSVVMLAGLTACGGSGDSNDSGNSGNNTVNEGNTNAGGDSSNSGGANPLYNEGETRTIRIGTWWDQYYDSTHTDIYENPQMNNVEQAEAMLANVAEVEEKYNVRIEFVNLTYAGVQESINTSILAGKPDCDIYQVELSFGIPAALGGFAVNLADILPADSDILTTQQNMKPISTGLNDGSVYLFDIVTGESAVINTYMLAYNVDLINAANLEDPRELWRNGEWTWDKWREYMIALTQDTNADNVPDTYGYGSRWDFTVMQLLMSNGATIAAGPTETLSSPATGEVLDFVYQMYNVDRVAVPWDSENFDQNMLSYQDGNVAFWSTAAWISAENGYNDAALDFEIRWVPYPVGPSGNEATNARRLASSGNAFMIPTGVENPELVYNVFYDYKNWYHDDLDFRDGDMTWWEDCAMTEENYEIMEYMGASDGFDLWNALGLDWDWSALLNGEMTAAQFQETWRQPVQTALDTFFN